MIQSSLSRLAWTLLLLAVQVLVLDRIHPWGLGAPMLCPLLIITLPLGTSRISALLRGFGLGLVTDIFAGTPGIGSAAMTLLGLMQPALLSLMAPRDADENLRPTFSSMGRMNHFRFIALLLLLHHCAFFALESFSYWHFADVCLSMSVSYVSSLILIMLVETVRSPKD